jgi:hypothetical protein
MGPVVPIANLERIRFPCTLIEDRREGGGVHICPFRLGSHRIHDIGGFEERPCLFERERVWKWVLFCVELS